MTKPLGDTHPNHNNDLQHSLSPNLTTQNVTARVERSVHTQKAEIGICQQVTANPRSKTKMWVDNDTVVPSEKVTEIRAEAQWGIGYLVGFMGQYS